MDTFLKTALDAKSTPSPEAIKEMTEGLSKWRLGSNAKSPETLQELAISKIVIHPYFMEWNSKCMFNQKLNPFADLPFGIVDKLVASVTDIVTKKNDPCPLDPLDYCKIYFFLLQVLNDKVLELDYEKFKSSEIHSEAMFFKHLLQNCPKIQKAKVTSNVWYNYSLLPRLYNEDIFGMMAFSWPNLTYLSVDVMRSNANKHELEERKIHLIKAVCQHLPNLCVLEISMQMDEIAVEDVQLLSGMQKLRCLRFSFGSNRSDYGRFDAIVHAAGLVPNLETFNMTTPEYYKECHTWFVKKYAELYPQKNLTLECHWFNIGDKDVITTPWTKCLQVEELNIYGKGDVKIGSINKSCLPPADPLLTLNLIIPPDKIIYFLNELGGKITRLTIQCLNHAGKGKANQLSIHSYILACPRLQHFRVEFSNGTIDRSSFFKLTADNFKNLKSFNIRHTKFEHVDAQISKLFKLFFLHYPSNLKSLVVESACELRAIAWALKEEARCCLDKLEELEIKGIPNKVGQRDIVEVIATLMQRSPYLKRVKICIPYSTSFSLPNWLRTVARSVGITVLDTYPEYSDDEDDDDYDDIDSDVDYDSDDPMQYFSATYDSDGGMQFDDIQSYLIWKDSWKD
ncbi:uncharacterized protein LOC132202584 [Neocloeon triangulifer]|uniref:uncharacterized protein LOC132202584 n=1 Tax=Neocloeon triangulifer TaxID=2078957 RepID=UPI00286F9730|nr:uncharacterized protein LOC132202584 [Neocloeon triangulifer]XP_059485560.1 uncharacterized protein LOC132202584 [Neocloeon triangulifer]XP_059485561.1 uncharacterized protein LOC132202584 [Neocloeon triangulifer]